MPETIVTQSVLGGSYSGTANYASTYELTGIDLYDTNENRITNWSMVYLSSGATVFTQNGRTATANVSAASVPSSWALLLPLGG